jgi:hypothetical protein
LLRDQGPENARILVGERNASSGCSKSLLFVVDTATAAVGLSLGPINDRSGSMHQQRAQIGVATFADPEQPRLASTGVLSRYQTQPGGKLSSVPKSVAITDGGHYRRGRHGPEASHRGDTPAFSVLTEGSLDPLICGSYLVSSSISSS